MENHMTAEIDIPVERRPDVPLISPPIESEFVSLAELGKRWGLTQNGVISRLSRQGIEVLGFRNRDKRITESDAVRSAAMIVRHRKDNDSPAADYDNATAIEPVKPEPPRPRPAALPYTEPTIAEVARPPAHPFDSVRVGDSDRVRRLLLALKAIRELTAESDGASSFAVWAVSDYAIAAESEGS